VIGSDQIVLPSRSQTLFTPVTRWWCIRRQWYIWKNIWALLWPTHLTLSPN